MIVFIKTSRMVVAIVFLVASCIGQEVNGGPYFVSEVLSKAHISGSLSYWGRGICNSANQYYPLAPALRKPKDMSDTPLEVLREMFAGDSKMEVTQDSDGIMRMFEKDVPKDLLDVKIHHLSFGASEDRDSIWHGPNMALRKILSAPEVVSFRKAHKIGPFSGVHLAPPDAGSNKRSVSGELNEVTVSEALDYILKTFPGLWIYGNCQSEGIGEERNVYFWFYENGPVR